MDFTALDLRIGTITHAAPDAEGVMLTVALGHADVQVASQITETYAADTLLGRQVVVVTNGPGGAVVLAGLSPTDGAVLLQPDRPVADGTRVV